MMPYDCNPSYLAGRDGRMTVRSQSGKKCKTYVKNKLKQKGLEVCPKQQSAHLVQDPEFRICWELKKMKLPKNQ
jgi:hypothetical protein